MNNNIFKRQIILYGLGGPENNYVPIRYECVYEEDISVLSIRHRAEMMKVFNPTIKHVWAIDNRPGLKRDFTYTIKRHNIESGVEFKDILEREGIKIL